MNPPERREAGVCAYCGDPILEGEAYYDGPTSMLHLECAKEHLMSLVENCQNISAMAGMFGFQLTVADETA